MEYKKTKAIIITIMVVITLQAVTAQTIIGVSPSTISFQDVLRGGYAERTVTITASSDEEISVTLEPRGEIIEWLEFSETEFTVSRGEPHYLKIIATPPSDIQNANYTGFLRLQSAALPSQGGGGATGTVIPVLDLYMNVQVTDIEFISCIARDYSVNTVEEGENLFFTLNVLNRGNVRINPRIKVDIWDQDQIEILRSYEYDEDTVFPTTEGDLEIEVETTGLELGQYWAEVSSLDCFSQSTLTFDILEEGSLRSEGSLRDLKTNPWIDEGDTTLVEAIFTNTGEKDVSAYFKGRVTLGDKTIQLIESDEARVAIEDTEVFPFFFTATKPGRYIVSGRVFYDNKRTYEKSVVVNVRPTGLAWSTVIKYLIYAFLLGGIIFLTYKIRQEKKKYNRYNRQIKHTRRFHK